MSLFIHCLPWDATFQALDLIFSDGSRALFIISLATLHSCKSEILGLFNDDLLEYFKTTITYQLDIEKFRKYLKFYDSLIQTDQILKLRKKFRPTIVKRIRTVIQSENDDNSDDEKDKELPHAESAPALYPDISDIPADNELNNYNNHSNYSSSSSSSYLSDENTNLSDSARIRNLEKFEKMIEENYEEYKRLKSLRASSGSISLTLRGRTRINRTHHPEFSTFRKMVKPQRRAFLSGLPCKIEFLKSEDTKANLSASDGAIERLKNESQSQIGSALEIRSCSIVGMKEFMANY